MLPFSSLAVSGVVVAALLVPPAADDDAWVRVRSPHFEVLSDAGEAPARAAALRLEKLRGVLLRLFPARTDVDREITLFLIQDRGRFSLLVPRERARSDSLGGFFQGGDERDYAVLHLSPLRARPFEAAEHEYAHLVLTASLPAQPVWVAEGLAELLSDAVLEGAEARMGASRPGYVAVIQAREPVSLRPLLEVRYDSPEYRGAGGDSDLLYAGSWALVRWVVHRQGLEGLRAYLDTLSAGQDAVSAFEETVAPLAVAEAALIDVPPSAVLRVPLVEGEDPPLVVEEPPTADVEQRLGDLLLRGGHTKAARKRFERALEADPGHVPSRTSLGGLLVRQGEWEAAREQLEAVLEQTPDDPAALLRLARLKVGQALMEGVALPPEVEADVFSSLETALEREPEMIDAALLLAALRPQPYEPNVRRLEPLFEQQPDRTELARALSGLYLKLGDVPAARRVLEKAREAARDPASRYLAEHLLRNIEGFKDATVEARGDLIHLKCRPDGSLLFTISADPRNLRLEAASTQSFFVQGDDGLGAEARLVCGEQDRRVLVRYEPGGESEPGVTGTLLWLGFEGS